MSGILIADDAESWYESGLVDDVTIRGNRFIECGGPVICIAPENREVRPDIPVHRNIRIEDNTFQIHDETVLFVKSTSHLLFCRNRIAGTVDGRGREAAGSDYAIRLWACSKAQVEGNLFTGISAIKNVELRQMTFDDVFVSPEQGLYVSETS